MVRLCIVIGMVAVASAAALWFGLGASARETIFEPKIKTIEPAPLCPWREPASDLKHFFPEVTRRESEVRILSGYREELRQRLGRPLASEEQALYLDRIYADQKPLGTVMTRRVKGEYGAIELVWQWIAKAQSRE